MSFIKLQHFKLSNNFLLPFVEEKFFIMVEILFTAVAADEVGAIIADGQFRNENQHFLAFIKYFLAEDKYIGKLLTGGICLLFEGLGEAVEVGFQ